MSSELEVGVGGITPAMRELGKHTTIVIPAYNEEEGLPAVLQELYGVVDDGYELLVVDDGSTDGTLLAACDFPCRVVRHVQNSGKGAAMQTGIALATGENIVFIDADGTYPAEHIPEIVRLLSDGYQYVRCTRRTGREGIPPINRVGNLFLDTGIAVFSGIRSSDFLTGLYGLKRQDLMDMDIVSQGFDVEAEIAVKAGAMGLKPAEIPAIYRERIGQEKLQSLPDGFRIGLRVLSTGIAYNSLVALFAPGVFVMLIGLLGLLWVLLSGPSAADQVWTRYTLSLAAFLLGGQLALAGLVLTWHAFTRDIRRQFPRWVQRLTGWCAKRLVFWISLLVSVLGLVSSLFVRENPGWSWGGLLLFATGLQAATWSISLSITLNLSEPAPQAAAYEEVKGR
jgi:glycosyltransferase involved in cell wall biosynthesis